MILSTLDKSRKGGAYEQIPSLVLGQRWTPQLNSRNMMKVVLCVWIEPYIENDLSFCVWPVHTPTTSKEVLTLSASTSPLPYTGNKSCIVNTILSVMPKHTVYIDPCMGSAEVFFRKPRAEKEILNDYNGDLVNLFRVIQNNEKLAYLLGRLYLSINGELAFKQNKDKVTLLYRESYTAEKLAWEHLNTWQWPYFMSCEKVESEHLWLRCKDRYYRCFMAKFYSLKYGTDPNEQTPAGGMLWGFPEMLEVDDLPLMWNRLAEPEKNFKTLAEAQADWEAFRAAPNPDFSEFCNDIFGDG